MLFTLKSSIKERDKVSLFLQMKDLTLISHHEIRTYEIHPHCVVVYTTGGKYYYDAKDIDSVRVTVSYDYSN